MLLRVTLRSLENDSDGLHIICYYSTRHAKIEGTFRMEEIVQRRVEGEKVGLCKNCSDS